MTLTGLSIIDWGLMTGATILLLTAFAFGYSKLFQRIKQCSQWSSQMKQLIKANQSMRYDIKLASITKQDNEALVAQRIEYIEQSQQSERKKALKVDVEANQPKRLLSRNSSHPSLNFTPKHSNSVLQESNKSKPTEQFYSQSSDYNGFHWYEYMFGIIIPNYKPKKLTKVINENKHLKHQIESGIEDAIESMTEYEELMFVHNTYLEININREIEKKQRALNTNTTTSSSIPGGKNGAK